MRVLHLRVHLPTGGRTFQIHLDVARVQGIVLADTYQSRVLLTVALHGEEVAKSFVAESGFEVDDRRSALQLGIHLHVRAHELVHARFEDLKLGPVVDELSRAYGWQLGHARVGHTHVKRALLLEHFSVFEPEWAGVRHEGHGGQVLPSGADARVQVDGVGGGVTDIPQFPRLARALVTSTAREEVLLEH